MQERADSCHLQVLQLCCHLQALQVATQLPDQAAKANVPADDTQDLDSSNTSKGVQPAGMSQPGSKDGSAINVKGLIAHYRYDEQLCMPCHISVINCAACATFNCFVCQQEHACTVVTY